MQKEPTRCFISLVLPEEIKTVIKRLQEEIKKEKLFYGKFTETENIHLTLKFLGEITDEKIEMVRKNLRKISFPSFEAEIKELGVFSRKFIRILWLSLGPEEVLSLQKEVDESLKDIFEPEARFMSHITIARVKNIKERRKLLALVNNKEIPEIKGKISSFSLMKSTLSEKGPTYETIERYSLG